MEALRMERGLLPESVDMMPVTIPRTTPPVAPSGASFSSKGSEEESAASDVEERLSGRE